MKYDFDEFILNICRYEFDYFLERTNVVGVGLGYKRKNGIKTCEKAILVLVKRKVGKNLLNKNDIIPQVYKSIKTDVIESGEFRLGSLIDTIRPVTGGYAIGPMGFDITGSYGGMVADDTNIYMLSNNHVIAALNSAPIGTAILQTSEKFGGKVPNNIVAYLSKYALLEFYTPTEKKVNIMDAALARIDDINLVSSKINFIGIPTGIKRAVLEMPIEMICSTSVIVTGEIDILGLTVTVISEAGELRYIDQMASFTQSQEGDSGGFFLNGTDVVGLHFSFSDNFCVASHIESVLTALNVKLVVR